MSPEAGPARPWIAPLVLAALATAVYATSFQVPFTTFDDPYYVTRSLRTQRPGVEGLLALWSWDDVWGGRILELFPLRDTIYWALWQGFGPNPLPFHAASVALHAAATVLVFLLAQRMSFPRKVAFWGAALFAVHPVHVESVTWVAGLKDPLFTLLVLGALLAYARYREAGRPRDYAIFLACLLGGLLSKSIALATPLLAVAMERWTGRPTPWRAALVRLSGPAVICGLFLAQYTVIGRVANVVQGPHGESWGAHVFLSGWAMVRYVQQGLVPASFAFQYCFRPPSGLLDWRVAVIALVLLGVLAAAVACARRAPRVTLLVAWFFACLLPVANLIPFPAVMADRYLYASTVASSLLISWAAGRLPGRLGPALLSAMVAVLGAVTLSRGVVWQDEGNLWAEVASNPACLVDSEPNTAVAFLKHAGFQRDPRASLELSRRAFSHPGFGKLLPEEQCRYLELGTRLALQLGESDSAIRFAEQAVGTCPTRAVSWTSLMAATARVDPRRSLDSARRAYRLSPDPEHQWSHGASRVATGDAAGAVEMAEATARLPARLCTRWRAFQERQAPPDDSSPAFERARAACGAGGPAPR